MPQFVPVSKILVRSRGLLGTCFCDMRNASPARIPNASTFPRAMNNAKEMTVGHASIYHN